MCTVRDAPVIACNNQLAAIQALHQAIQIWTQPTLPFEKLPQVATPPPTHTRQHPILRLMRRPARVQPQDLIPRVVIQKPNASPSSPTIPSIKEKYETVARQTRSKVPHPVDPPPPRVSKARDLRPIDRRTRSQTTSTTNLINPAQVAKQQYPAQFLQSLAMPVLD